MAHWIWKSSYAIGIKEIDEQHKNLLELINKLNISSYYKKEYMVEEVLEEIQMYTIEHFSFEEELMRNAGYPDLETHMKAHKAFINRIEFFKERYENGEDIGNQLMMDLQLWLLNHIKYDDMDYKNYLKSD